MIKESPVIICWVCVRVLATISMVVVMAGHAVFGCCWHHAHASHNGNSDCRAVVEVSRSDHGHGGGHCDAGNGREHQNGGKLLASHEVPVPIPQQGLCDESDCVFVRPDDGQNLNLSNCNRFVTAKLPAQAPSVVCVTTIDVLCGWHYQCAKPALRSHLWLQVLLI